MKQYIIFLARIKTVIFRGFLISLFLFLSNIPLTLAEEIPLAEIPTNFVATTFDDKTISLSWSGNVNTYLLTNVTDNKTFTIDGEPVAMMQDLSCDTLYTFQVQGKNLNETLGPATTVQGRTFWCGNDGSMGGIVKSFDIDEVSDTSMRIRFEIWYGAGDSEYFVGYREKANPIFSYKEITYPVDITDMDYEIQLTELQENTTYDIFVGSRGLNGEVGSAKEATTLVGIPTNFVATTFDDKTISLSWSGNVNTYLLTNVTDNKTFTIDGEPVAMMQDLSCDTLYTFQVQGKNLNETLGPATTVQGRTFWCGNDGSMNGSVKRFFIDEISNSSMKVSFEMFYGAGDSEYFVGYRETGDIEGYQEIKFPVDITNLAYKAKLVGLRENTQYDIFVGSRGQNGGDMSGTVETTLSSAPLKVTSVDDKTITLTWEGSTSHFYIENLTDATNSDWISSNSSYTFSNLKCSATYTFSAKGGVGAVPKTVAVSFDVSTVACPVVLGGGGGRIVTIPVTTNVVSTVNSGKVTITWDTNEPTTSAVEFGRTTSYGNSIAPGASSELVALHKVTIPLSLLQADTAYHFRTRSSDSFGDLGFSTDHTFRTSVVESPTVLSTATPPAATTVTPALSKTTPTKTAAVTTTTTATTTPTKIAAASTLLSTNTVEATPPTAPEVLSSDDDSTESISSEDTQSTPQASVLTGDSDKSFDFNKFITWIILLLLVLLGLSIYRRELQKRKSKVE